MSRHTETLLYKYVTTVRALLFTQKSQTFQVPKKMAIVQFMGIYIYIYVCVYIYIYLLPISYTVVIHSGDPYTFGPNKNVSTHRADSSSCLPIGFTVEDLVGSLVTHPNTKRICGWPYLSPNPCECVQYVYISVYIYIHNIYHIIYIYISCSIYIYIAYISSLVIIHQPFRGFMLRFAFQARATCQGNSAWSLTCAKSPAPAWPRGHAAMWAMVIPGNLKQNRRAGDWCTS